MFTINNIIQRNRLVRLIIILMIIIGLTMFLYTSYYANPTLDRLPSGIENLSDVDIETSSVGGILFFFI